jgi:hypothetical protein
MWHMLCQVAVGSSGKATYDINAGMCVRFKQGWSSALLVISVVAVTL